MRGGYGNIYIAPIIRFHRPFFQTLDMIPTRNLIYYLYIWVICHALTLIACQPIVVGPTQPSGYRINIPSALQMSRSQPLTVNVLVTDANGSPVHAIPVSFRLAQPLTAVADLAPLTVYTHHGQATTTLRAKTAGYVMVEITVEDITETLRITIVGETPRF